jgi:2-C-methyl-D-erythritol 4-phosphate cytidylyltransferase
MKRVAVIMVAAGEGRRFGLPKQYAQLKSKPVLDWALEAFEAHPDVAEVILVLNDESKKKEYTEQYKKIVACAAGGRRRQDSVVSGFHKIDPEKTDIVLIHDGVRPLVSQALIGRVIEAALEKGAVVPAIPLEDTVKRVNEQEVVQTLEREKIFRCQTPQGFFYSTLKEALEKAAEDDFFATDDANLVERIGKKVWIIQGDPGNIKITTPEDLKIAEALLED